MRTHLLTGCHKGTTPDRKEDIDPRPKPNKAVAHPALNLVTGFDIAENATRDESSNLDADQSPTALVGDLDCVSLILA